MKGLTRPLVAKLKTSPNAMLMGRAGSAFLKMARSSSVKQRPIKMATKHARVVFQSPYDDAFPTKTLSVGENVVACKHYSSNFLTI